ncbi:MAG TPA: exo-alpha-sialidase [Arthrobacter sp.]
MLFKTPFGPFRYAGAPAAAAALLLALSACTSTSPATSASSASAAGYPAAHVHGITVDQTGRVLLATHEGLFDVSTKAAVKIGPSNDLMGFTPTADPSVFYASGHPGKGSELPNPVGLIRSVDGGRSWEQRSRQGESDFHALTATRSGIVAFDGSFLTSPDGKSWTQATAGFQPAALAGNPDSDTVLATTPDGLQRSTDGGKTWLKNASAPVIQFAAFATPSDAVGIEPGGKVHYSADGGSTWKPKGSIDGQVQAMTTAKGADGTVKIWVATKAGVLLSTDGGTTFTPYKPA